MDGALEEASEVLKLEAGSVEFSQPFIHATNIYVAPPVYIPIYSTPPLPRFIPTPHCEMDVSIPIFQTKEQRLRKVKPLAQGLTAYKG